MYLVEPSQIYISTYATKLSRGLIIRASRKRILFLYFYPLIRFEPKLSVIV